MRDHAASLEAATAGGAEGEAVGDSVDDVNDVDVDGNVSIEMNETLNIDIFVPKMIALSR